MGRGVTSDSCIKKTAPVGGPSSQDHGRPTTRGQGDGGQSISHPRVVQEKVSVQPCQECSGVFHHQQYLKEPSLTREVSQRPATVILHDWRQNFAVWGGRKTLSMCSGSTTNTMLPPLRRCSG